MENYPLALMCRKDMREREAQHNGRIRASHQEVLGSNLGIGVPDFLTVETTER